MKSFLFGCQFLLALGIVTQFQQTGALAAGERERISLNDHWHFKKYGPNEKSDELIYDVRPEVRQRRRIILGEGKATLPI